MSDTSGSESMRWPVFLALGAVMLLVLLVRALGFEAVLQEGQVVFPPADPQYHLRRAFYTFVNFPSVLLFDPYINHPGGAAISWPPLFDFALGGVARALARDVHGFELVAAWAPPVLGASTAVPLLLAGRALGSARRGLAAGCIFAFLPTSFFYTALGTTDHHAAVALIGAWLLYLCMVLVDPKASGRSLMWRGAGLALVQLAMLLTWHGSLLYLALGEGVLLVFAIRSGSRSLAAAQSGAAVATLVGIVAVLVASPEPLGGWLSSIALSWLHVLALAVVALVSGALSLAGGWLERGGRPVGGRFAFVAIAAVFVAAPLLLFSEVREGLTPALGFLGMEDGAGLATNEQRALFAIFGRAAERDPTAIWGWLAYLLPLAPIAPWLHARRQTLGSGRRAASEVLVVWTVFFGALAIAQMRYGNDFAPAASLSLSLGLAAGARALVARFGGAGAPRIATPVLGGLAFAILIAPAVAAVHLPRAQSSLAALRGEAWPRERARASIPAAVADFLREVREVTPATSGYLSHWQSRTVPEYGVIAHPNLGHAIQYLARRPTGTDPFWAYIGEKNWAYTREFLSSRTEERALRAAKILNGRYVITMPASDPGTVSWLLHFFDGNSAESHPALERFRLVTESTGAGPSLLARRRPDPPGTPAYKLFEIVAGTRVEVMTEPGARVIASVSLTTPSGRNFDHVARARADEAGIAKLRLPYTTTGRGPVRSRGPYRVRVDGQTYELAVPDPVSVDAAREADTAPIRLDTRGDG